MRSPTRSRRVSLAAGALTAAVLALPLSTLAQEEISRIDLPQGWQPEGIATDGEALYAGSLADGAIYRADPATGAGEVFVPGEEGAVAVGLDVDAAGERLWVAGGDSGEVRAYDLGSGELLETYTLEAGFLNDLVATSGAVYVTDSFLPQLVVIPIEEDGSLAPPEDLLSVPISGELEYSEGFNLNGIVASDGTLIVVHSPTGALYRIDATNGETSRLDTGDADLTAGDGMVLVDSRLYVVRNQVGRIAVLELAPDAASAQLVDELVPPDVDVPTTAAHLDGTLWAVNARFGTEPTPETEYWITRIETPEAPEVVPTPGSEATAGSPGPEVTPASLDAAGESDDEPGEG